MRGRFYLLILLPALSAGLFLAELLRRHGYASLGNPFLFSAASLVLVLVVIAAWITYSLFLRSFAGIELSRSLLLDLFSYVPFLGLLAYFVPGVDRWVNVGTFLFSVSLALSGGLKVATLIYYRRSAAHALLSRPYVPLGLIVALGLLLRVSLIAANRFHGDEALYGYWGLLIASGEDIFLKTVIVDKPPVFLYTLAFFFRVFGPTETAARLPNIMASLAGIVILYYIARELFDHRVATVSALFLALSPFDIQFAPTAFTDPLMVTLSLASCLLAVKRRYVAAGAVVGLAVMTKPTALFFLPLVLFLASVPLVRGRMGWSRDLGKASLRLGLGFGAIILAVICWDVLIRVDCINFLSASAARYGGLRVVPVDRLLPRVQGWMRQIQYLTGSQPLNIVLVAGSPLLIAYGVWRRRGEQGWLFDSALAGFAVYFVSVHTLLSFSIWDRYMLGLAPVVALLLSRIVLLPLDGLGPGGGFAPRKVLYISLLGLFLFAALLQPTRTALRYDFPVGGDHGAFQGIDDVGEYFRANVPAGSIVFHKWLGWHYSFYMFDLPLEFYYYPSVDFVLNTAQRTPHLEKYVVFPSWTDPTDLRSSLRQGGWELREVYRTYRPDGSLSFTIYDIEPIEE